MQFVVTALDYTDPGTLQRRIQQREAHLARLKQMMSDGRCHSAGAILDENDRMIGSSLHLEFPDRATLEQTLQNDPYVINKVWQSIEIRPVKLVPVESESGRKAR